MKASEVMTARVVTTTPEASVEDVARTMLRDRISGVPVLDANEQLVGIVTEGDLLRRAEIGTERSRSRWLQFVVSPGRLAQEYVDAHARKVGEVMTRDVVSVGPDTPLAEVVALMESRRIKRMPVLAGGKLVGIISRADLLQALTRLLPARRSPAASDAALRQRILEEIDLQRWAPRTSLDVIVKDRNVDLCGVIFDERERQALHVLVENVPGVQRVRDNLVWLEPISGMVIEPSDIAAADDRVAGAEASRSASGRQDRA